MSIDTPFGRVYVTSAMRFFYRTPHVVISFRCQSCPNAGTCSSGASSAGVRSNFCRDSPQTRASRIFPSQKRLSESRSGQINYGAAICSNLCTGLSNRGRKRSEVEKPRSGIDKAYLKSNEIVISVVFVEQDRSMRDIF